MTQSFGQRACLLVFVHHLIESPSAGRPALQFGAKSDVQHTATGLGKLAHATAAEER